MTPEMATLSWNEIRDRALKFSREWATVERETAEAQSFWNAFFEVFGKARRTVAAFEEPERNLQGQYGFIDLFWRGLLLVEHKTKVSRVTSCIVAEGKQRPCP